MGCSEGGPDRHMSIRDSFAELIHPAKMKNRRQILWPSPRWVSDGPGAITEAGVPLHLPFCPAFQRHLEKPPETIAVQEGTWPGPPGASLGPP